MKLTTLIRQPNDIIFGYTKTNADGHEESFGDIKAHEAPHPAMDVALSALTELCKKASELSSVATIEPISIKVTRTKHGTRSVKIGYLRTMGINGKTYTFKTPPFQIDDPAQDEDEPRQCSVEEVALVLAVIDEGVRYAEGERQQRLLPLEDEEAEPSEGEEQNTEDDLFNDEPPSIEPKVGEGNTSEDTSA